ncbi:MAG: matrixin family metalloprotease [Candidatus Acidiferrales bacterium]
MRRTTALAVAVLFFAATIGSPLASGYSADTTLPSAGGCPALDRWNVSVTQPLNRRWSTSLPLAPVTILTVAAQNTSAQLTEIENTISAAFGVWTGVTGTTLNAANYPGALAPLTRVSTTDACSNDAESNIDGLNTICFNQSSLAFTTGVLAFTRVITANAPGASVGSGPAAAFAGQILDADTLFRNDSQATFATPGALATTQGQGAYDLESLLTHELGHWLGLDHSAVWRAMMFPYAPPPGQFLGARPTAQSPDAPLSDDDRTGVRMLYPDPNDVVDVGAIRGSVMPANPFALATVPAPNAGGSVTGIYGAHVVAVDAATGEVVAGAFSGWSCNASSASALPQFDGSYDIERLPVGHNYWIYAEPLVGLAQPGDFGDVLESACSANSTPSCNTPAVDTNFNPRVLPSGP